MSASEQRPKKHLRTSRACDFCHKRSIKCFPSATDPRACNHCVDFDVPCTYNRPNKRGRGGAISSHGPTTIERQSRPSFHADRTQATQIEAHATGTTNDTRSRSRSPASAFEQPGHVANAPDPSWRAFASVSRTLITSLLGTHFQVVHPIFPYFDRRMMTERLARDVHLGDRDFLASIMAACSLAAARMRDGSNSDGYQGEQSLQEIPTKVFVEASESCLPADITNVTTLDALRAYPLLALTAIQEKQIDVMHKYIGLYFAILSIRRWHDETNWPATWSAMEKEEMRRLYWSTYTLDVFTSIVWNGCVHFQEAHARVQYPTDDTSDNGQPASTSMPNWIVGWNFTTDLYRVLEHAVSRLRSRSSRFNILETTATTPSSFSIGLNDQVNALYLALPEAFKTIDDMTGIPSRDIYGFQSANIQATLALLRMVLFSVEMDSDVDKKCAVASDLLAVFHRIPKFYLRAISAPLVYHLSGIGQILSSVITSPISEVSYAKVRELLLSMSTLLETLESALQRRAGAARSLLDQVTRIDQFMAAQRQPQADVQAAPQIRRDTQDLASVPAAEDMSYQFQLPDDIVGDWSWPLEYDDTSNSFLNWYNIG